jgi:hypothetical protein
MEYIIPRKSRISLPGSLPGVETFFRDIAPGAATVAGAKPPGTFMKIRISAKPFCFFLSLA